MLGECLSRVELQDGLHAAAAAYEAICKPRCERVQLLTKGNADMLVLPDGPELEDRDRKFRELMEMQQSDLRDIGRDGIRAKLNLEPDANAPNFRALDVRIWLYGCDAIGEVGNNNLWPGARLLIREAGAGLSSEL